MVNLTKLNKLRKKTWFLKIKIELVNKACNLKLKLKLEFAINDEPCLKRIITD
jgi:hypothetical protein